MTMKGRYLPKGQLMEIISMLCFNQRKKRALQSPKIAFDPYLDLIIRLVCYCNDRSVFGENMRTSRLILKLMEVIT